MADVPPGELLIVRFSPMNPGRLLEQAEDEAKECLIRGESAIYSISIFGIIRPSAEVEVDELIMQICKEAPAGGRTIWTTTKTDLLVDGLDVQLSEPPPHHYDVILGDAREIAIEQIEKLVRLLEQNRRRNPAWKK